MRSIVRIIVGNSISTSTNAPSIIKPFLIVLKVSLMISIEADLNRVGFFGNNSPHSIVYALFSPILFTVNSYNNKVTNNKLDEWIKEAYFYLSKEPPCSVSQL